MPLPYRVAAKAGAPKEREKGKVELLRFGGTFCPPNRKGWKLSDGKTPLRFGGTFCLPNRRGSPTLTSKRRFRPSPPIWRHFLPSKL